MIPGTFLRLVSGDRLNKYIRLKMDPEFAYKYGSEYTYAEIPTRQVESVGLDTYKITPACSVDVVPGFRYLVEPNHNLNAYGVTSGMYLLHGEEGRIIPTYTAHVPGTSEVQLQNLLVTSSLPELEESENIQPGNKNKNKKISVAKFPKLDEDKKWAIRIYMVY